MAAAPKHEPPTLAAQVVEHALGENLHDWIARSRGHGASWRQVAKKIRLETGHDRHEDTVRSWYPDLSVKQAAGAAPESAGSPSSPHAETQPPATPDGETPNRVS